MYIFFLFFLLLNSALQTADLPEPINHDVWKNIPPLHPDETENTFLRALGVSWPLVSDLFPALPPSLEEELIEKNDPLIVPNSPFPKRKQANILRSYERKKAPGHKKRSKNMKSKSKNSLDQNTIFTCEETDDCKQTFSSCLNLLSHCSLQHKETKFSTPGYCLDCAQSRSIPRRFSYRSTAHRDKCNTINKQLDFKNNRDLITKKRSPKPLSKKSASTSTPSTKFRCIEDHNTCFFISNTYTGLRAHCSRFHKDKKLSEPQTCLECSEAHNNPRSFCYVSLGHLSLCHIINQELDAVNAQKNRK